ncbi:MAG: glycosyltransferase family 4 protein [Terriglobales bacterium]
MIQPLPLPAPPLGRPAVWTRPLTVAYFSNTLARGGAEEHVLTLLRGLDQRRFRPALVCTPQLAEQLQADLPAGVEVQCLAPRRPAQLAAAARLGSWFWRRRPEIVHSHLFYASLFASPLARLAGVPVVIETPHLREKWRQGGLKSGYLVDRMVARGVDYFVAVSAANARYLAREKGLPERKIVTILNGCDCERFAALPAPSPELRARLGLEPGAPVLAVLGRLEPQKGHAVLLEAMPAVLRRFPRARLLCVGAGRLAEELRARAQALGIESAVRFAGFQSDVRPYLALATITVLPSFYEGLPLAAMESLAAGVTIVATAVDGTPEIVRHEETGLLVPSGDPPALAAAINRLLQDDAWRARLAQHGRVWVRQNFDRRRQIESTQALYLEAWRAYLSRRGRRARAEGRWTASPKPEREGAIP